MRLFSPCGTALLTVLLLAGCTRGPANGSAEGSNSGPDRAEHSTPVPLTADQKRPADTPATNASGLAIIEGAGDLGEADYGEKKSTRFTIKNTSGKPVRLEVTEKSCACAGLEIDPPEIPANGTTQVTLSWIAKLGAIESPEEGKDKVTVRLQARGDANVFLRLEANGNVKPALHFHFPRGKLDFGSIDLAQLKAGTKELAVVVYTKDPKRRDFRLEAKSTNPGLRIVPAKPERLGAADLTQLGAVDGYRVNIRCGEGLPVGSFHETIGLKSNVYESHDLEIAAYGYVETGAVSVKPQAVVNLPATIDLARGYKCPPLTVTLNFEPNRTLTFEKVEPSFLQVEVEKVKENVWRVDLQVPAGEEAVRKHLTPDEFEEYTQTGFDAGSITLKTDHPLVPTLKIAVDGSRLKR